MLPTSSENAGRFAQAEWLCKRTQTEIRAEEGKADRNWVREHLKWDSPPFSFPQRLSEEVTKEKRELARTSFCN